MTTNPEPPKSPDSAPAATMIDDQVRRVVLRRVLPAFVVYGLFIAGSLWMNWRGQQDRLHDQCIAAVESRDNFRTFAHTQQDQWDANLAILPPDNPKVQQMQATSDAARAAIDETFPSLDGGRC
jgi:hypothetical protein